MINSSRNWWIISFFRLFLHLHGFLSNQTFLFEEMSVFSSMADKGKSPVPTDVPSQQVVDQGFGKLTLSDIIEDIDKLQNTFGNIREKLQFLKEICEQMSFGSDNFKLTHKHTNKIEGYVKNRRAVNWMWAFRKFGDGISLLRDRREKLNKVERVTAPLSNTDEKGDEHVSDHSIPPIPMDIGDSGNREVQQEDKMDADQALVGRNFTSLQLVHFPGRLTVTHHVLMIRVLQFPKRKLQLLHKTIRKMDSKCRPNPTLRINPLRTDRLKENLFQPIQWVRSNRMISFCSKLVCPGKRLKTTSVHSSLP